MDDPAIMIREEAAGLFNHVGTLLADLEKTPQDPKTLETLQQDFHSIKVLSTLVALPQAAELARKIYAAFDAILAGDLKISREIIDITEASQEQLKEEIEAELDNIPIDPNLSNGLIADWERFLPGPPNTGEKVLHSPETSGNVLNASARILIIDDEAVSRKLLENIIRKHNKNIEIVSVDTAEEGIFRYLTDSFDLVFLDIIMPNINGDDFIAIVEKNNDLGNLPDASNIVVQTAVESMEQLLSYIKKACVQEVIRKPVTPDRIVDCLERYCH